MEKEIVVLMADDDADDKLMAQEAFAENKLANDLQFVSDGKELLDYLTFRNGYSPENAPKPDIILLDINMPKMSGIQVLEKIKQDPELKKIPVIMLTTSDADEDIVATYDLGVNSFITKPVTFEKLVEVIANFSQYWFKIVRLPK